MNVKLTLGVICAMMLIDVTSSQGSGLLEYVRRLLGQHRRQRPVIQIIRAPHIASSSAASASTSASSSAFSGLADIGLGGMFGGHGGLLGGTIGLRQPQTITLQTNTRPTQTIFARDPSEDALRQHAARGLGVPVHSIDVNTIDPASMARFSAGGQQVLVDRPDPADPIDVLYAPRSMVSNPGDAARLQRMTDSDAIILV